jgi:hypothetical protein
MPWWAPWVAAGVLVVIATMVWWWVPKWQANRLSLKIRDPKARADVEDNFRKTIGQLLGGAAVLIGTGFAITNHSWRKKRPMINSKQRTTRSKHLRPRSSVSRFRRALSSWAATRLSFG